VEASAGDTERPSLDSLERGLSYGRWGFLADSPTNTALAMLYTDILAPRHESRIFSMVGAASAYLGTDLAPLLGGR